MDVAVKKVIDDIFAYTIDLLEFNRPLLEEALQRLLERETLDESELLEIAKRAKAAKLSEVA